MILNNLIDFKYPSTNKQVGENLVQQKGLKVNNDDQDDYRVFLKKHGFSEMNCPFTSFLRRKELSSGIEAGAI